MEHREPNVRQHQGRRARALRSTAYRSREWEGRGKSTPTVLDADVFDHQQWEIQPLDPGYTIRKVGIVLVLTRYLATKRQRYRSGLSPPESPTSSVLARWNMCRLGLRISRSMEYQTC